MRLPEDTSDSDGPNLTPVIDVVFLLLIFFLVATRYDQEERELEVDLPEVTEAQRPEELDARVPLRHHPRPIEPTGTPVSRAVAHARGAT